MLPSLFVKVIGACLLIIGVYDTSVYRYALTKGEETFNFFGRRLQAKHVIVRVGFATVLTFYYVVGLVLVVEG